VLAAWLGFFGLGCYGPWVAYLAETAPADQVGLALGAAMAINQLGIICAPPLLGLVHDLSGGYTALWGCLVAGLAVAYALTARMRRGLRREAPSPPWCVLKWGKARRTGRTHRPPGCKPILDRLASVRLVDKLLPALALPPCAGGRSVAAGL
jgi:MFS family permease